MGAATDKLKFICKQAGIPYVGTRGAYGGPICVMGEAPGEDEERECLPFVGYSGKELTRMCSDAALPDSKVWFTNPYKVRPPENDLDRLKERGIPLEFFHDQFFEELRETKPTIIVAAGATPLGLLCPFTIEKRTGTAAIGKWRGSLLTSPALPWPHYVVPMHHPAFILREYTERQVGVFCLARAKEEFDFFAANNGLQPLPQRELIVTPSFQTVVEFLTECMASPDPISIDIEMLARKFPYTISLAVSPWRAISFCLWDYPGEQGVRVWRLLDAILWSKRQIGQNYIPFDCCWLEVLGFRPNIDLTSDTMVRHHVLWPEFEHRLQFQTMQYTREPYYKDEGKTWKLREGKEKLMRYNAKDTTTTYEVWLEQEKELDERPHLRKFLDEYEMRLAHKFHFIEKRGVLTDKVGMDTLRDYIDKRLDKECADITAKIGKPVATDKTSAAVKAIELGVLDVINLNSPPQVLDMLKARGLKMKRKRDTGKETTAEAQLQQIFAETGDDVIKGVLAVRELSKMRGTYVNAKLADNVLYCSYVVTGTVTGRRSSRKNFLGLGTNHQNQPKHSDLAKKFRECLIARPGKIFVYADQAQAEDYMVQGIIADVSGDRRGLDELESGVDRHRKLASFIFAKPAEECGKDTPERFLGKKTRHAGHYGMQGPKMSLALAQEGFSIPSEMCDYFLTKFHEAEPSIRNVFQKWIEQQLITKRMLRTPLGRERYFLGLRPYSNNSDIFRDAYSWIPQSTVGDNTGLAILWLEDNSPGLVIMDTHDAATLEVDDNDTTILNAVALLQKAFDREIVFPNGLRIKIPVEIEIGYDMKGMKKCADCNEIGLLPILATLRQQQKVRSSIIGGVLPQSSQPASSAVCG